MYSQESTKYQIIINFETEGIVEKSDVIGAIFGQTEGLLGDELDLRDLQRSGRVGRIDVKTTSKGGNTKGEIVIFSSIDKAETALLAASIETIERVGPCASMFKVVKIEDSRIEKRKKLVDRAKEILIMSFDEGLIDTNELIDDVRQHSRIEKMVELGEDKVPAGPNVMDSDAIIVVEGRADVINLLKYGIKNAVAVEGTNIPQTIVDLCRTKTATAFVDGDRGGDLILSELIQVADIDFVAVSPRGRSVEDMSRKEIVKPLRYKVPLEVILGAKSFSKDGALDISAFAPNGKNRAADDKAAASEIVIESPRNPMETIIEHATLTPFEKEMHMQMKEVKKSGVIRFTDGNGSVLNEFPQDETDAAFKKAAAGAKGFITPMPINQSVLDRIAALGLEFAVSPEFCGIVKKPVSIRLINVP
ncbi:MAG: DNA primase [Methanomicrobium sp.]|nr:DNA primase [Methanomicrobium sp.]MBR6011764.1 DNA primase [Methanomicrobium sp.]MBR6447369.1 DNA primase [Methanomicrobium sp.]MBR6497901.1 DNA primase [Methanomicrobium sp.]